MNTTPPPYQQSGTLAVPNAHPRLWWNAARIAHAKQWATSTGFHPRTTDSPQTQDRLDQALTCVLGGDDASSQAAVDYLMGLTLNITSPGDDARWYGEAAVLIFDWCHDRLTPAQISTLATRWSGYVAAFDAKAWGGVGMEYSNYYTGFMRNDLEWGVASQMDNPAAPTALNDGLVTRWQNSFIPFASTKARGGTALEGSQYGAYQFDYMAVPLVSAGLLGRNLFEETSFYREGVYYLLYSTTPSATTMRNQTTKSWDMFPHADDEQWLTGDSARKVGYGNFMTAAAMQWSGEAVGQYARRWLNVVAPDTASMVKAVDEGGTEKDFASLPLDYYAQGPGFLYTRNKWGTDATSIWLKADSPGDGHAHHDFGSFQMWRKGAWLTRESVSYTEMITDSGGVGTIDARTAVGHNTLTFGGMGFTTDTPLARPTVLRMEHRKDYTYFAVDTTPVYRTADTAHPERDNKNVGTAIREYIFVKPLETLLVVDRVASTSELTPADQVKKTFNIHFEQRPTTSGNKVIGVNGDQALAMTTLLPASPSYRVVDEASPPVGQFRVELDTSGAAESYFVNVLQARDASGADVQATLTDTGSGFTIAIVHPTQGTATITIAKGMTSTGGTIALSSSSCGVQPLTSTVQPTMVTKDGPVWGN